MKPQVIIRTAIGAKKPLDGGPQHTQDYTSIFKKVLTEIEVIKLQDKNEIFNVFKKAVKDKKKRSYLIIENGDMFNKNKLMNEKIVYKKKWISVKKKIISIL